MIGKITVKKSKVYDAHTKKWYEFTDKRVDGKLLSRSTRVIKKKK